MRRHTIRDEQRVIDLYSTYSMRQIAALLGIPRATIRSMLVRRGIPLRPPYVSAAFRKGVPEQLAPILTHLYWDREMSMGEMASFLGWTEVRVRSAMCALGIPRRTLSEAQQLATRKGRDRWKDKAR